MDPNSSLFRTELRRSCVPCRRGKTKPEGSFIWPHWETKAPERKEASFQMLRSLGTHGPDTSAHLASQPPLGPPHRVVYPALFPQSLRRQPQTEGKAGLHPQPCVWPSLRSCFKTPFLLWGYLKIRAEETSFGSSRSRSENHAVTSGCLLPGSGLSLTLPWPHQGHCDILL